MKERNKERKKGSRDTKDCIMAAENSALHHMNNCDASSSSDYDLT